MTSTPGARHPWKALAALIAAAAVLHGVCAHADARDDDDDETVAHVHILGHHLALRTACPSVDDELPDDLAQAFQDHGSPVSVPVEFKLRGSDIYDVALAADSPRLMRQVRQAVRAMSCDSHDDAVHTVDLVVRFVDPATAPAAGDTVAIDDSADD